MNRLGVFLQDVYQFLRYDNLKDWLPRVWGRTFLLKTIAVSLVLGMMGALFLYWLSRDLPTPSELTRIEQRHITSVYDLNGLNIKQFYVQKREPVTLDRVPRYLREALLATEDRDFYQHWGIDLRGIGRAMISNFVNLEVVSGASTLTQQLARNLFDTRIGNAETITRKLREQLTAIALERNYSKDEILQMYLNQMYFANGAYGIQQAARNYFNKNVEDLDLNEAAYLVGILQGPYFYYTRPQLAVERRNRVLRYMVDAGYLDQGTAEATIAETVTIAKRDTTDIAAPYFVETIRQHVAKNYGDDMLYREGANIRSTLDWRVQEIAQKHLTAMLKEKQADYDKWIIQPAIEEILENTPEGVEPDTSSIKALRASWTLQGAFIAMDPSNGDVLALIGGRDFEESEYNRAIQANRQAGSSFKPFLYTAALDNGYTPASTVMNQPIVIPQPDGTRWTPSNYYEEVGGELTLRDALRKSMNLVAARLVLGAGAGSGLGQHGSVTPQLLVKYARQFGISTPLRAFPSLAIGSGGVELIEMVSAYSVFANLGNRAEPRLIRQINDYNGAEVERNDPVLIPTLEPALAYLMVDLMKGVLAEGGTAQYARTAYYVDMPAAGKTGTTNDFTDAWFIGYTPKLVAGVWVGFDDHHSMQLPGGRAVTGVPDPSGAVMAMPIWARFMRDVYKELGLPKDEWQMPPGVVERELCRDSQTPESRDYKLALPTCPNRFTEIFLESSQPTETCKVHDLNNRRDFRIPPDRPFR